MEHETYWEQLSALLDGELNETDRAAVTAHLAQCADCQAYLAELTALRDAMGAWGDEDVPGGFAEGVMERVRREAPETLWRVSVEDGRGAGEAVTDSSNRHGYWITTEELS